MFNPLGIGRPLLCTPGCGCAWDYYWVSLSGYMKDVAFDLADCSCSGDFSLRFAALHYFRNDVTMGLYA